MSSSRLPAKSLLHFFGLPLFLACFKRVEDFCEEVFVCTSLDKSDDPIAEICKMSDVRYFRGDLNNVLLRFFECSEDMDEDDTIIRLTCDNPLPCSNFLRDMSIHWESSEIDYLGAKSPTNNIPLGLSAEFFKVKHLRKAHKEAVTDFDKEHVTPFIKKNYNVKYLPENFLTKKVSKLFTIDTFDDYLNIYKSMKGYDPSNLGLNYKKFIY